ncbi:hypothetical protein BH11MYX1_BH11MYX1_57600 [soil metagenome]
MTRVALVGLVGLGLLAACGHSPAAHDLDASSTPDASVDGFRGTPQFLAARTAITADQVGVIVNDDDPLSVATAEYYVTARMIPAANVVHLHVPIHATITAAVFAPLADAVTTTLASTDAQVLAITWTHPFAVDKMSITSAFALGSHVIADTCTDPNSQYATPNPYSTTPASTRPFTDLHFRPAMVIPATTIEEAKALIDRGVASDDTWPTGSAYLMRTHDANRSARCILNPTYGYTNECQTLLDTWDSVGSGIAGSIVMAESISNKTDVMFYVQGLSTVPDIATNTYLPGAVADHLTSSGGSIPTSGQMSAFEFLRAGATGSYGTVAEPCAYQQKFPNPAVLVPQYFAGATLIEAYWKSVVWPAEGIFIGEPLARPFGNGVHASYVDHLLTIDTTTLVPGRMYRIEAADSPTGPFTTVRDGLSVPMYQRATFTIDQPDRPFYRFGTP